MVAFRIDRGGALILVAVLLIGIVAMNGDIAAGLLLGTLTAISLLLHECGHMLAARALGVKVHEFGICLKGSYVRRVQARAPVKEAAIALSGPMVNAIIAAAMWTIPGVGHLLAIYNLVLLVSNIAPLPGSDGRRIFTSLIQAAADARIPVAILEKEMIQK